jgi:signal transduction histidine kinase
MNAEDCHRPEDWKHSRTEFEALARGDRKMALAVPFRTKDGEVVYADVGGTVISIEGKDLMVGFLRDLTEARRAEEALKTAHMKLMTARDEERKYIASELHDSVSQKLVALSMQLQNNAQTDNSSSADICSELIADIRGICHGLYPPALETLGLVSALTQLERYGTSAGLVTAIRCDPRIIQARFAPNIEIALFRIAQEAVNNSVRHSRGTNLDIDLVYTDGQLVLAVIDDGQGFDVETLEGTGLGLSSMRDRARAIAAKLTIDSEPGETRIEVAAAVDLEKTNEKKGL